MKEQTDVLVIGGGPAGATAATLLARQGFDVTLLERDAFPREHIGESLLPSCLPILDLMGAREKVDAFGFQRKYGGYVQWGPDEWELKFADLSGNALYTFQVVRADFDRILLDHARSEGVEVHERTEVTAVELVDGRASSATWRARDGGATGTLRFRRLVDCSGRAGILSTRYLRNRRYNQAFQNVGVWGYWAGAKTPDRGPEGALLVGSIENGWLWAIPLHTGELSVGLVVHKSTFKALRGDAGSMEALYREAIASCPLVADLVEGATLTGPVQAEQDFSYLAEEVSGPGYLIAGDAAAFLDPLLASGVHLAMYSGLLSAAATASVLRGEVEEDEAAGYYDRAYRQAYLRFMVLVSSLYQNYRGKETLFWQAQQLTNHDAPEMSVRGAFLHVVSGVEDLGDAQGARGMVVEEMKRLVAKYFPKGAEEAMGPIDAMSEEERQRYLAEMQTLNSAAEFSVSAEAAVGGLFVRTEPLGLARAEASDTALAPA